MATALRADNVSKQYRIYATPADRLKESLTRGRLKRHQEFWALKDVSFEIEKGTTTGIIGPNGSGKSTLLQIITGTLNPTHGNVDYDGRVAALLELGAGFNPEFTRIENLFKRNVCAAVILDRGGCGSGNIDCRRSACGGRRRLSASLSSPHQRDAGAWNKDSVCITRSCRGPLSLLQGHAVERRSCNS